MSFALGLLAWADRKSFRFQPDRSLRLAVRAGMRRYSEG